jgi:hypothetical protein
MMPTKEQQPAYLQESQGNANIEEFEAHIAMLEKTNVPLQVEKNETNNISEKVSLTNTEPDINAQMTLTEARKQLPLLKDLDDESFVDTVHQLYYPAVSMADFDKAIGYIRRTSELRGEIATGLTNKPIEKSSMIVGTSIIWILLIGGFIGYYFTRRAGKETLALINQSTDKSVGISGWLSFLIIALGILTPVLNFGNIAGDFHDEEATYAVLANMPAWATYKNTVWLTLGGFSAFSIYAALQLRFIWKPSSVTVAKVALILWPVAGILIAIVIPSIIFTDQTITADNKAIGKILTSIISAAIWITYLFISKRVRATYIEVYGEVAPIAASIADTRAPNAQLNEPIHTKVKETLTVVSLQAEQSHQASAIAPTIPQAAGDSRIANYSSATEDELYEKIGSELASGNMHTPTWLKAFAQANGDEKIAKANYIKLRIEKLFSDEKKFNVTTGESLATKKCPNCAEVIKLEAFECRFCKYQFSEITLSSQVMFINPSPANPAINTQPESKVEIVTSNKNNDFTSGYFYSLPKWQKWLIGLLSTVFSIAMLAIIAII